MQPIEVTVTRGGRTESVHRVSAVVADAKGGAVHGWGEPHMPVFPRSAIKAIQALPLVETGAAEAFGFGNAELSLACASHSGEARHVETARGMLGAAGLDETCLECGGHWSFDQPVLIDQARTHAETPGDIFNNCSGKHSGFCATCAHVGDDPEGYAHPDHPAMGRVARVLEEMTGERHDERNRGTDGCSIPTYAISLTSMARAFARMCSGDELDASRAAAARKLLEACMAEPFHMAGTNRFCTKFMNALPGRVFAKTGAEGVFCGAVPELGLGLALKVHDGATRASEAAMAAIARKLLGADELTPFAKPTIRNWNGIATGGIAVKL